MSSLTPLFTSVHQIAAKSLSDGVARLISNVGRQIPFLEPCGAPPDSKPLPVGKRLKIASEFALNFRLKP